MKTETRGVVVALAPSSEAPDLVDLIPWDERREPSGYPELRMHRDALDLFGLREKFDAAQEDGEFVKATLRIEA